MQNALILSQSEQYTNKQFDLEIQITLSQKILSSYYLQVNFPPEIQVFSESVLYENCWI